MESEPGAVASGSPSIQGHLYFEVLPASDKSFPGWGRVGFESAEETRMRSTEPSLLRRFFGGLAENTFQTELGVADPPLIDYITDLLTRFVQSDAIYRIRDLAGRPLREVVDMMAEAQERVGNAKRDVHRQIGDYTLFWAGVYPEALGRLRRDSRRDHLVDYCAEGKKAYWIASTLPADQQDEATPKVLERLSLQYDLCAYGLREIRRHWEHPDEEPPMRPFLIN